MKMADLEEGYAGKATVSGNGCISIPRRLMTEKRIKKGDVWKFFDEQEFLALPDSVTSTHTVLYVVIDKAEKK